MKTTWTKKLWAILCSVMLLCSFMSVGAAADNGLEMLDGQDVLYVSLTGEIYLYCYDVPFGVNEETLVWSVGDDSIIALYAQEWYAQAIGVGETTLTVASANGKYSDTVKVVVYDATPMTSNTAEIFLNPRYPMRTFIFTPDQTGYYQFNIVDEEAYVDCSVHDADFAQTDYLFHGTTTEMTAGETYYLCISSFMGETMVNAFSLTYNGATEPEISDPTAITFEKDTITMAVGDVIFYPAYRLEPEESWYTSVTYSIDDESLLFNDEDMWTLTALAPGTATVTITTENGLTDTLTVVINEDLRMLTTETSITIDAVFGDYFYADFIAPEAGYYVFYSVSNTAENYPCCNVYSADGETLVEAGGENGLDFRAQVFLEEGQTVTLELMMLGHGKFDVYAAKPVDATGVELVMPEGMVLSESGDTVYIASDYYVYPMVSFLGAPNLYTETYELTVASDDVVPDEGGYCYLEAGQSATFTVTTASGLTDTITVVAIDSLFGDINFDGKVGLSDAVALFYTINGAIKSDSATLGAMELNGDNKVSLADAMHLVYYVNGVIDVL